MLRQSNTLQNTESPEQAAWEYFEVGSYEEISALSSKVPHNAFLNHLACIATYEDGDLDLARLIKSSTEHKSVLSPLLQSYIQYNMNNRYEAAENFMKYVTASGKLVSFTILRRGVRITYEARKYEDTLKVLSMDNRLYASDQFLIEKLNCFFYLQKNKEFLQTYKAKYEILKDRRDISLLVGLVLYNMGKYKESEIILLKTPGRLTLPDFEDKRKEFLHIIENMDEYKNKVDLSVNELRDLGFAYLFNADYKKAEEVFQKAILIAK
jgi:tetratricopeptide (TPR) repeat protein